MSKTALPPESGKQLPVSTHPTTLQAKTEPREWGGARHYLEINDRLTRPAASLPKKPNFNTETGELLNI